MGSADLGVAGSVVAGRRTEVRVRILRAGLGLLTCAFWGQVAGRCQDVAPSAGSARSAQASETLRLAHGLLRERKFDLAAEEYERFLRTTTRGSEADDARFGLANARLFQGRYKEARQAFQEFLKDAPRHARARTAWYRLGELATMLGDLPEARQALERFVNGPQHPNLETAWTYLGDVCLGLNDLAAARAAYERSLADYPHGQLADRSRFGLGRTLAGLGELDAAAAIFSKLTTQGGPDWIDRARLQLGKLQLARGRFEEALKLFEVLHREAPGSVSRTEVDLGRGEALAGLGRSDEAAALLATLVADGAETVASRAALALATLELERSRLDQARAILETALTRYPSSALVPAFRFRLAEALQKQSRLAEARAAFVKLAEEYPGDPWADDAVARAAAVAIEGGDHAEALRLARQFASRFPESPLAAEVRFVEARALIAAGQPGTAVPLLEGLVQTGPDRNSKRDAAGGSLSGHALASARYELALAYRATGQPAKADSLLASLASEAGSPVGPEAQFLMAQALVEQGRFAEAVEPLRQFLAAHPKSRVEDYALAHLAAALLATGRFDDAWGTMAGLEEKHPESPALPAVRLRLAEAALDRNQPGRAAEQFRQILTPALPASGRRPAAVDPSILDRARLGLGRALWKQGKPAEAAAALKSFLEANPDDARAPAVALERAQALEAAEQDAQALAAYTEVTSRHAKSPEASLAILARARLLARIGQAEAAAALFGELLSSPERRTTLATAGVSGDTLLADRAWALADAGQTAGADAAFAELLKSFPESLHAAEARFYLAESANQAGDHQEVVRLLSPLASPVALDGLSAKGPPREAVCRVVPLTVYRLGRSQAALGDWAGAAATLGRLVRDFPGHPRTREARYLLGEAALQQGQPESAEPILAALEADPATADDPPGFSALVRSRHVQCLLGLKRWNDALRKADSLRGQLPPGDPAIAELDLARGRALIGLARLEEAREAFRTVIEARKGGDLAAQAHLLQGETYFHQERFGEALREFWNVDILYDSPPWQAAALLEAGKVYERLGRWTDAAEAYERLRSRFPKDPRAAEAEARLAAARKQAQASSGSAGKVF